MTTIQELKNRINEINILIEGKIKSDNPETFPIYDGIIDIEKYFNAKYKILWILKEPYDEIDEAGNPAGGGWSLPQAINQKKTIYEFGREKTSYKPMLYASWGILNNFCLWNEMNNVEDDPSMLYALNSVAYINVKKLPGRTTSNHSVIENAYQKHKEILLKQIEYYNPDIIIGGATLPFFFKDFGFIENEMLRCNGLPYIINSNKIYISAYHPAQRTSSTDYSQEAYCDDIINAVKIWTLNNNK